ncbi:hypothetical protein [Mycobacterium sp.]|uniref:hypothetical protein n=1 Tax=Mycobacterium sp. TaxID=1785 RepID=UPI00333FBDEE
MAAAPTDTTTATSGDAVLRRRRGKSRTPNFTYDGPVSVIGLELDVSDSVVRRRVERQCAAMFRLRRAVQRDAQHRCRAYWAAHHERDANTSAVRQRLGLSGKGIEAAAKAHIEASGWMRDHLTKAIGLHVADEVWETVDRHLFADSSGRRHGPPRIGSWWDFTRIPGRARSHTKTTPAWETWRLVGTLDGHLGAYRHRQLPAAVSTAAEAARQPAGTSILSQPTCLAASTACAASVSRKPWPSAPMTARTAVCAPTATSRRRRWRRASSSPIPMTRAPRVSTTDLPTPYGRGWPPRTSGRAQSTGTSHQHHLIPDRPGPAATAR